MSSEQTTETPVSMAGVETHGKVLELVRGFVPGAADFVDLGAGQGAFTLDLVGLGHRVTAVDADPANWKVPGVEVIGIDLDRGFSGSVPAPAGGFDAAVAIEIIEHLENPFAFVREAAALLRPGGLLFLTTPNVESVSSRLIFFYTGRLAHFGEYETVRPAHITPIFRWKLQMMLDEAGFEIVSETFNRKARATGTNLKGRIAGYVVALLEPFVKGVKGGECRIIVARRKTGTDA